MQKSDSIAELAKALALAQGEMRAIPKESNNPFFKSKYADLTAVIDGVRGPLAKHGLSYVQLPSLSDNLVLVTTMLLHTSGEWISEELKMPAAKADAQGIGSAITYARRYALQAIVGVAAEEDDDGNGAVSGGNGSNGKAPAKATKAAERCEQEATRQPESMSQPATTTKAAAKSETVTADIHDVSSKRGKQGNEFLTFYGENGKIIANCFDAKLFTRCFGAKGHNTTLTYELHGDWRCVVDLKVNEA